MVPRVLCPACGGAVHPVAGRCKHCKADLTAARDSTVTPRTPAAVAQPRSTWGLATAIAAVLGLGIAAAVYVLRGDPLPVAAAPSPPPPPPPPIVTDVVRPPSAGDLASYTADLAGSGELRAEIDTAFGTIHCVLLADQAPLAVANFIGLATGKKAWRDAAGAVHRGTPFYDGLVFHRVVERFLIQGGDPEGTGFGGPGYALQDENLGIVEPGALAMANGSQFFIAEARADGIDGQQTIFGRCTDLAVIQKIARLPTFEGSERPVSPVRMTVTITRS